MAKPETFQKPEPETLLTTPGPCRGRIQTPRYYGWDRAIECYLQWLGPLITMAGTSHYYLKDPVFYN